jgi:hypothetical protein
VAFVETLSFDKQELVCKNQHRNVDKEGTCLYLYDEINPLTQDGGYEEQ